MGYVPSERTVYGPIIKKVTCSTGAGPMFILLKGGSCLLSYLMNMFIP